MFLFILRRCLSPVSENWNGSLPPWEWIFAFLADILSRPLGVGCYFISQHAWCNYAKILQSLFVERVRVLAPEPKPLERTAWDSGEQKPWPGGGIWGRSLEISSAWSIPVSAWTAPRGFQDLVLLPRRSMPRGQSFPERDGRRNRERLTFISQWCFGKILTHNDSRSDTMTWVAVNFSMAYFYLLFFPPNLSLWMTEECS